MLYIVMWIRIAAEKCTFTILNRLILSLSILFLCKKKMRINNVSKRIGTFLYYDDTNILYLYTWKVVIYFMPSISF
jgi:hypothetical protein